MPLPDLDILVAVLDSGSLTAAAERLDLPRATLSRRLTKLEEDVGVRLLHRSTRTLTPTDAGLELYKHARPIVEAVESAKVAMRARDGVPRGLLRVTLPPGGSGVFGDILASFMERYPEVRMEVLAVTRHVDLVAEGFDVGVRAGELHGSNLISRRLFESTAVVVASPTYLATRGTPTHPDELAAHQCNVSFERGEVPRRTWPLLRGGTVPIQARFSSNDLGLLTNAALRGHGLSLLPKQFIREHIEQGLLVEVLTDHITVHNGLWIVFPEKRLMLPRVRAFIDHVAEARAAMDWQSP